MKKLNLPLIGLVALSAGIGIFLLIRSAGEKLVPRTAETATEKLASGNSDFVLVHVLLALVAILVVAHLLGMLFHRLGQPPVVGEMIAGILLGPSLLGRTAPAISIQLFPPDVLPFISVIAQIGVILYMFLVGVELDTKLLRDRAESSLVVSQASILAPFLLGSVLALWIYPVLATQTCGLRSLRCSWVWQCP